MVGWYKFSVLTEMTRSNILFHIICENHGVIRDKPMFMKCEKDHLQKCFWDIMQKDGESIHTMETKDVP